MSTWKTNRWAATPLLDRLMMKTRVDEASGCWIWVASLCRGYGQINVDGLPAKAHRVSWELHVGPIPEGLTVDHLCRNTRCINPAHLELVTLGENTRRQLEAIGHPNARKTRCPNGHPYDEQNTRFASKGKGRVCRICRAESSRAYRQRKKSAA